MKRIMPGGISRGRLMPFLIFMLIFAFFMLIGSGVYAGGDRKGKKRGSGESTKKGERARRNEKSTRAAIKESIKAASTLKKADRSSSVKRSDSGKDSGTLPRTVKGRGSSVSGDRTGGSRRDDRSRDGDRSTRQSKDRIPSQDSVDRGRSDDSRWTRDQTRNVRDRVKNKKKEEVDKNKRKRKHPGWSKEIIRPGGDDNKRIPPGPGGRRPPPPPGGYHDGDIIIIDEDIIVLPPPPLYPHVGSEYIGSMYEISLPCGVIEPDGIEPAFLEKIEHIREIGRGDSLLVCLFQTIDPMTSEEINYLFMHGVTFYRFLSSYTAIIDLSVQDIFLLVMDLANFRWIGDYKPEYKYWHEPPESSRRGAYVVSLFGDSNEFREDLKHIGIQVVTYYEDTEDYYVIAEWEHFPEIAGFWWVEKVHKEPESFSSVYDYDTD
jgi:hypothetical protein